MERLQKEKKLNKSIALYEFQLYQPLGFTEKLADANPFTPIWQIEG